MTNIYEVRLIENNFPFKRIKNMYIMVMSLEMIKVLYRNVKFKCLNTKKIDCIGKPNIIIKCIISYEVETQSKILIYLHG